MFYESRSVIQTNKHNTTKMNRTIIFEKCTNDSPPDDVAHTCTSVQSQFVTLSLIRGITKLVTYQIQPNTNINSNIDDGTYPTGGCDTRPVPCKGLHNK